MMLSFMFLVSCFIFSLEETTIKPNLSFPIVVSYTEVYHTDYFCPTWSGAGGGAGDGTREMGDPGGGAEEGRRTNTCLPFFVSLLELNRYPQVPARRFCRSVRS